MSRSSTQRTVLQQGQLDGFCLLYAVLNAFSAVYSKQIEFVQMQELWARLISITPSLQNFASFGSSFSELPNNKIDIVIKQSLVTQYAEILSDWLQSHDKASVSRVSIEPVCANTPNWYRSMVSEPFPENLAYIACLKRRQKVPTLLYGQTNEHWIAIVGNKGEDLAIACSYTSHHMGDAYKEWDISVGKQKRAFNNLIIEPLTSENLYVESRYQVSLL